MLSSLKGIVSRTNTTAKTAVTPKIPKRYLNIHEYQSQKLMKQFGINCPNGNVAETPAEAVKIAEVLNSQDVVIKAQVLAGGRGKGFFGNGFRGGVHICNSTSDLKNIAEKMLGQTLFTKQTGPKGKPCNTVFICERYYLRKEMYFAILLDRKSGGPAMVVSSQGGMDIETVAKESPDAIHLEPIDIIAGPTDEQLRRVAEKMGFSSSKTDEAIAQMRKMYEFFRKYDCTMLEINPMAETNNGVVMAMDAKLNFDDNASFRQKEVFALRDKSQEDVREVKASDYDLNYIGLDGNIGCLVNGAGLAMATLDIIKQNGGNPANFLDVGGGASQKQVTEAIKIISADPNVKSILINIFGGIMKCDIIALGLIAAVKEIGLKIPLVVRLQGTNVEAARKIMDDSGLRLIATSDLDEAAKKAVRVADIVKLAEQAELDVSFQLPL
jgi:succinyl-CoA synthetase beta subunit